jgi:hypothetical protein
MTILPTRVNLKFDCDYKNLDCQIPARIKFMCDVCGAQVCIRHAKAIGKDNVVCLRCFEASAEESSFDPVAAAAELDEMRRRYTSQDHSLDSREAQ